MPLSVQIKQWDVETENKDEQEVLSSAKVVPNIGSEDSDESIDDDVRSLSPDEILVSSDQSDAEESLLIIPYPPDSDVPIFSDDTSQGRSSLHLVHQ